MLGNNQKNRVWIRPSLNDLKSFHPKYFRIQKETLQKPDYQDRR